MSRKDVPHGSEEDEERNDPVLRDVGPYCSDPDFIRAELRTARSKEDALLYIENRIQEEEGSRKGDLRILLNRLSKKVEGKSFT